MNQKLKNKEWRINHLYRIRDKHNNLIIFVRNRAQNDYASKKWFRNLILKARQLGFTTDESVDSLDDVLFTPNMDALMIGHNLDAAASIFDKKIKFNWDKWKPQLKSLYKVDSNSTKTLKFDFGLDSKGKEKGFSSIAVDTSGRSGTFQRVHITELAEISKKYPKKVPDIIEGTIPAVPPNGRIDIESTSQGANGEFYEMFMDAWEWQKEHPGQKPSSPYQWKAHFYNWTWDDEELDQIKEPIPYGQMEQGEKFREYAEKHRLSTIQITYYYQKWLSLNKKWNALKREYPTTPEEAFSAVSEGTYYGELIGLMEENGQIGSVPYDRALKVHTVWDLGVGKNMVIGFYQRDKASNRVHKIDYLVGEGGEGMVDMIPKVLNKPYIYGYHFGPHDLETTEIGTGKTRIETAKSLGLKFTIIPDHSVEDRINATQIWLSRLWVDKNKCKEWIRAMKNYSHEWDEKRGMYKDEPLHDWASHGADEGGYAAMIENKMTNDSFNILNRPFRDQMQEVWSGEKTIEHYDG